jgi:hypothetical protein
MQVALESVFSRTHAGCGTQPQRTTAAEVAAFAQALAAGLAVGGGGSSGGGNQPSAACAAALRGRCPGDEGTGRACNVCAGRSQHELRDAGCTSFNIASWCESTNRGPPLFFLYDALPHMTVKKANGTGVWPRNVPSYDLDLGTLLQLLRCVRQPL